MLGESAAVSCWRAAKEESHADWTGVPGCASPGSGRGTVILRLGMPSDLLVSVPTASNENRIPKTSP